MSLAFARSGVSGLFLADVNAKALKATADGIQRELPHLKVVTHQVDVGDEESCVDCVRAAVKAFGRIDYVLNNVGIGGNQIPTVEQDSAELKKVLNVNFVGLWICQREQVKQMLTQEKLDIPSVQSFLIFTLPANKVIFQEWTRRSRSNHQHCLYLGVGWWAYWI